ncbi:molybdopterin synthase catalytic subunit [Spodoptera frugiperda]|uniref:Molybdopterin synthase catalytic subunit n=1 Tax=Spodoptera frugiperda TaxID=7108 RepID=A0A9R0EPN6_SPOFR|nr:molybdopterin synthase catalytic subunit [Spodoptera frugiperda]XP_050551635.1 molybdopterin synthase catalytic subunit [Spodoptera frugiperda]
MDHLKLTPDKLSVDEITDLVTDDRCGAVSVFIGTTRDNFEGKKVLRLEYEAYEPMALKAMKSICDEARDKWPALHNIAIYHRLGMVPCREASVVIAVSSPHRRDSLDAVSHCIETLKASVPIWKKEVYDGDEPVWKENVECTIDSTPIPTPAPNPAPPVDKSLVQINVSCEELQQRIQNFIERKREQVNISNIHDFIPNNEADNEETETCARVRTQFVRRGDSKGHLKVHKVHNEWGPQTVAAADLYPEQQNQSSGLPSSIAERVVAIENYLNIGPVSKDIYRRLKDMEDKIAYLQSVSPEYAQFWKAARDRDVKQEGAMDYAFSADDIARKIEQLEKGMM